jgi:hypothetical protein
MLPHVCVKPQRINSFSLLAICSVERALRDRFVLTISLALNKKLGRSRSAYRLRPTLNGQARGEGERMAVRHDKRRAQSLFLSSRRVAGTAIRRGVKFAPASRFSDR